MRYRSGIIWQVVRLEKLYMDNIRTLAGKMAGVFLANI